MPAGKRLATSCDDELITEMVGLPSYHLIYAEADT